MNVPQAFLLTYTQVFMEYTPKTIQNRWKVPEKCPKNIFVVHLGWLVLPGCLPTCREHLFSTIRYLHKKVCLDVLVKIIVC